MKDTLNLEKAQNHIVFATESQEEEVFHQDDLIRMFPYGLSVTADPMRPFLLFKDEAHQYTLPVAVTPIEAGVSLAQSNKTILQGSPHRFTLEMMNALSIEIKQCVFVEIKGSHQYVRLFLSGHPALTSMKLRADEAMSLCLYLDIPFYATKNIIGRSRVMSASMEDAAQNLSAFGNLERNGQYLN